MGTRRESPPASGSPATAALPRRHRLVVVDDNADLRELVCLLLDDEDDFDVVGVASNGRDAVRLVRELAPDLVLLDIAMPVMNGMDALRRVRAESPATNVVMLSAYPREIVDLDVVTMADAYLDKGIIVTDLVDRLRAVLGRPQRKVSGRG